MSWAWRMRKASDGKDEKRKTGNDGRDRAKSGRTSNSFDPGAPNFADGEEIVRRKFEAKISIVLAFRCAQRQCPVRLRGAAEDQAAKRSFLEDMVAVPTSRSREAPLDKRHKDNIGRASLGLRSRHPKDIGATSGGIDLKEHTPARGRQTSKSRSRASGAAGFQTVGDRQTKS